jgi:hypothetical protein
MGHNLLGLKARLICLASKRVLGGRLHLLCASRRFIDPSRACTNSVLPSGSPVWVHRQTSVSLDSISPAATYYCHARCYREALRGAE